MANRRPLLLTILAATLSIALAACSPTKDDGLKTLKTKLTELRKLPSPRDEDTFPPTYFQARDDLRDWVENQLSTLAEKGGDFGFATSLNEQLKKAKLTCAQCVGATGGFADGTGYVGDIRATRAGQDLLEITTQLGVQCGYDETPYLYRFEDGKWRRVWDGAQGADDTGKYEPHRLETVRLNRTGDNNSRPLVLSLSHFQGCKEAEWQPVFYGLWAMAEGEKPQALLAGERVLAYTGNTRNQPIYARMSGDDDLLVEYAAKSIDPSLHDHVRIEHFRIYPDKVEKIAPFGLTPRDIVEEWLTSSWDAAQGMTADEAKETLADQHKQFHTDRLSIKFDGPTMACPAAKTPNASPPSMRLYTMQVHVAFHNLKQLPEEQRYFRIKWTPPYMFEVAGMTDTPAKDCTDPEPAVDRKSSLFGRRR